MLYNYSKNEMLPLQGHQNAVRTLSATNDGKWMLTADFEDDCVIVIWDTENRVPVCSIFNPHGKNEVTAAKISPDGKYVVSVGNEKYQNVNFWLWTYGRDKPDATIELNKNPRTRIKKIDFNGESADEFVLTTESSVIFFSWNDGVLLHYYPFIKTSFGTFNSSCYIAKTTKAVTATDSGHVLVWDYNNTDIEKNPERKLIKTILLQKCSITIITNYESVIVTGNTRGVITFYDKDLKLLCWCEHSKLGSIITISFDIDNVGVNCFDKNVKGNTKPALKVYVNSKNFENCDFFPADATSQSNAFIMKNFIISTSDGLMAYMDMKKLKYHFIWSNKSSPIKSLDAHPENDFMVTGNNDGFLSLFNLKKHELILSKSTPAFKDYKQVLEDHPLNKRLNFVTSPESHESLKAVTALKFSPSGEILACGMENGVLWILYPITLEPLDKFPYKHSRVSILFIDFDKKSKYMAYADDEMTVAVFKRNCSDDECMWSFLGKIHSHGKPIKGILFGDPISEANETCRLFSVGEDKDLIEYDLRNSGPYPDPGLKIQQTEKIEHDCVPLCFGWYPQFGVETFLIHSNSQYKFKLVNDIVKMTRGTFLGPTFGFPVQHFQILPHENPAKAYMIFATKKEIGLQLLPLDGNPFKILGIIGHPREITRIAIAANKKELLTLGYNDQSVLMWKINFRSVDVSAHLGGKNLQPYYSLIEGGKEGWLMKEIRDFFYFGQILEREHNMTIRNICDKVSIKQIPNLMRAIGVYLSNQEFENIVNEVSYKNYARTGQLVEEINFQSFVKLYINHRPVFGFSFQELKKAFLNLSSSASARPDDLILTRDQFLNVVLGKGLEGPEDDKTYGEPLSMEEAHKFLKLLILGKNEDSEDNINFDFLPARISYKDFIVDFLGIEMSE
ncbi:cilia- and flagella-associated protein 251-like [Prorops nasuta]|uniref:cilia- and flagella-associated protein 251-like n=1 Tax=Prorops nasuta TaxID=863751 RepID=UPI0034D01E91